ncbi:MAG: thiamine-phosphate kinase [Campylobacterales bacterium]
MQHEFELIRTLVSTLSAPGESIVAGPGDDCACVRIGGELLLISNDEQIEDRHFKRSFPPHGVGYKLIAANVSDILACGGTPKWVNLSLALPGNLPQSWIEALYRGIDEACRVFGLSVTGGNTAAADKLHIGAFILGTAKRFVPRSGARPGDVLMLGGTPGKSRAGLEKLLLGQNDHPFCKAHLYPAVPLHLQPLIETYATAAIDISDALAGDLGHLMTQSGVGFEIADPGLLCDGALAAEAGEAAALEYALFGGEDYLPLFTVDAAHAAFAQAQGCVAIGRATRETVLKVGQKYITPKGFEHF